MWSPVLVCVCVRPYWDRDFWQFKLALNSKQSSLSLPSLGLQACTTMSHSPGPILHSNSAAAMIWKTYLQITGMLYHKPPNLF